MKSSRISDCRNKFNIKLLAGNNVVLVEANGHDSEIFVPQLIKGRIAFVNIIPNRRCCQSQTTGLRKSTSVHQRGYKLIHEDDGQVSWRMQGGEEIKKATPLAYSTPITGIKEHQVGKGLIKRRVFQEITSSLNEEPHASLMTPEQARRAAARHMMNETVVKLPNNLNVIKLYRQSPERSPQNVGRLIGSPCSPPGASVRKRGLYTVTYNNCLELPKEENKSKHTSSKYSPGTKWHKVITPVRTYAHKCSVMNIKKSGSTKKLRPIAYVPTYMINPTQGKKGTHRIEVRKRKLIIDSKINISPQSFKKQQQLSTRNTVKTAEKTKKGKQYKVPNAEMTAFDLLTNSNRNRTMSTKLQQQFRKRCVNKASSTCDRYKMLCPKVPPLKKHDEKTSSSHETELHLLTSQTNDGTGKTKSDFSPFADDEMTTPITIKPRKTPN